jgi:hypothetical protein
MVSEEDFLSFAQQMTLFLLFREVNFCFVFRGVTISLPRQNRLLYLKNRIFFTKLEINLKT